MLPRDIILDTINFKKPPYVPWSWWMTHQSIERIEAELGIKPEDMSGPQHIARLGSSLGDFRHVSGDIFHDNYGTTWDRSIDKDIGTPCDCPIKEPQDLDSYTFPDSTADHWYKGLPEYVEKNRHLFTIYCINFSLYERSWMVRGMENLLMDMIESPEFVEKLLDKIVEHNLGQIRRALAMNVDAVYFGDDYGSQTGLIMGLQHWRHFIKPRLKRMWEPIRSAGKKVFLHSCGCVASLFDDLVEVGLNVFNPFQPEVMDIYALKKQYQGRLAFHGGMSVQKILPFGTVQDVRQATHKLIEAGSEGGLIFSPSHDVPRDVPPANLVAMMEILRAQKGFVANKDKLFKVLKKN